MITITLTIVLMFLFAMVVIDGAIVQTTKTMLQNAADAAALAGVSGLVNDVDNLTLARERAKLMAAANKAVEDIQTPVIITNDDIEFPEPGQIRVTTHRTAAKGDPVRTYFLRFIDLVRPNTADVTAVATAEVYDVCGVKCVKPWSVPDRFNDVDGNGEWTPGIDFYDPIITGFQAPGDVGLQITLHSGNPSETPAPGQYFSIDLPPLDYPGGPAPITGGDAYREFIAECAEYTVAPGDWLQCEPGQMVGPTVQGVLDLIAQDPNAQWDAATQSVINSDFGLSPRVALIPFFNPEVGIDSGRYKVEVTKVAAFFIESVGPGSRVTGRFLRVSAPGEPCEEDDPESFIVGLHLIE